MEMALIYHRSRRIEEEIASLFAPLHESSSDDLPEDPEETWMPLARHLAPPEPDEVEADPEPCALDDIRSISQSYREHKEEKYKRTGAAGAGDGVRPADVHEAIRHLLAPAPPPPPRSTFPRSLAAATVAAIAIAGALAAIVVLPL